MTMHVAVSGWLLGPHSGANRRLLSLLAHMPTFLQAGERVTVLHRPDFVPPHLDGIGWQSIAIPAAPTWRRLLAERRLLPRALRELGATVLDHGFLLAPDVPVPVCLLVHDLRAVDGHGRWPRWLARAALRRSLTRATLVVAPSAWTASRLRALAPSATVAVVHNGVDVPAATDASPPFPIPANGYVLHVGHLEARKNLTVVVDALRSLPAATRPELWLAGRDAGALATLRARAGDVVLRVLGVVPDAELGALYHHARTVVVPSVHEGFGLPALEALAHGARVLVSNQAALPEVVGDAGTVLPAGDAAAWAHAIARTDDGIPPRGRRQRASSFPWSAAASSLLDAWRRAHRSAARRSDPEAAG